jgi:hypothetical protein
MVGSSAAATRSCSLELGLTRRPCRGLLSAAFQNVAGFEEINCLAFREGLVEGPKRSAHLSRLILIAPQTAQPDQGAKLRPRS